MHSLFSSFLFSFYGIFYGSVYDFIFLVESKEKE